jgi:hypothetical protein
VKPSHKLFAIIDVHSQEHAHRQFNMEVSNSNNAEDNRTTANAERVQIANHTLSAQLQWQNSMHVEQNKTS